MLSKQDTYIVVGLVVLLLVSIVPIVPTVQGATEIYVDSYPYYLYRDGTAEHPYETIQKAINLASPGDTIYVFGGSYNESIVINKKLTIIGGIDDDNSTINYDLSHRYSIEITGNYVTFEGFDILDNNGNIISDINGALIHITGDNAIIQRNTIKNCTNGWGIYLDECSGAIIGRNTMKNLKSAIYASSSNTNDVINNEISDSVGAGIELRDSMSNRLYNNTIENNQYGLYARDCSNLNISFNDFHNNRQHGIGIYRGTSDIIYNNSVVGNDAIGVRVDSPSSIVKLNTIDSNQIGIHLYQSNCLVYGNSVIESAVGIHTEPGTQDNIIYNNYFSNEENVRERGSNYWDDGSFGNYWSDYNNIDENMDEIGDYPYNIGNGRYDYYPLGIFLQPPNKPSNPSPSDEEDDVGLKITLEVDVSDPDNDLLDVYFYDAVTNLSLGKLLNVPSGSKASFQFTKAFDSTILWYVYVTDGKLDNTSDIWYFTTKQRPPENQRPVAKPGGPYVVTDGVPVHFNANQSYDPDGSISFYRWNFGDGSSEILAQSPVHKYESPGTYEVVLTVIDNVGTSATNTTTVEITNEPILINQAPTAIISGNFQAQVGEPLTFDGSNSFDIDGTVVSYQWQFGGGSTASGSQPTYVFQTDGSKVISLTVTDDDGETHTATTSVVIEPAPLLGIPGFELVILLGAIVIMLTCLRNKNKK